MVNVYGTAVPANTTGSTPAPKGIQTEFSVPSNATLNSIRIYSPTGGATDDLAVVIYLGGTQTQLKNFAITPNAAVGWHTYNLPTPLSLAAGTHYVLVVGKETGTLTYCYALATLPTTANGITIHGTAVRSGAAGVWAENNSTHTDTDTYYFDLEVDIPTALTVNAGADQGIFTTGIASLSASATGGSGTKTYTWTKVSGPAGTFTTPSSAATSFTPTGGVGTYTLRCIVTDTSGTAQDDVVVTVTLAPTLVGFATIESSTGWTPTGGTMLAVLSDDSDSTLATTTDNPTNILFDGYLPVIQAPGSGQNFISRVRCDRPGSSSGTITGRLYEGATLRSTVTQPIPATLGDVNIAFPASDLTAIAPTSWTDIVTGTRTTMRVSISATAAV